MKTKDLENVVKFYIQTIGCTKWVSQPEIEILKHDNFIIGFHASNSVDSAGLFTFFYETTKEVDSMFELLKSMDLASTEPKENSKYKIYNFFAKDVEGRNLEFQTFLHELPPI
ncbi:MAG: VOC family protein [Candidatus Heimdallarchaeota archaeon]|nr:VOC family protein [Candidatus Heimdallarchaeota archaeon]